MTVKKSKLIQYECKHHGFTEFYSYGYSKVCATCAREKKRVRDNLKRLALNRKPLIKKTKVEKQESLTEYFIDKYKETIDSITAIYKIRFTKRGLIRGIGKTVNAAQFLMKMKEYYHYKCKRQMISVHGWKHSTLLKYRYRVRDNNEYVNAPEELKKRIRRESVELANDSTAIPLQLLKDKVDALPIIKDDSVIKEKPKKQPKQELIFHPKYTTPDETTGFIGVKKIEQKRSKSAHSVYYIATFRGKQIGFYETIKEAAIAYNNEVIKVYGDYAVSGGILNKVDKETTYLGCKGVTLKNGKYVSRLEFEGKEVYNKTFDDFNTAIKEHDKEVVKYFGKDSNKLNYKIVTNVITTCTNLPSTIKKKVKKNKPSTWLTTFKKNFLGTFVSELDACLAYNKAVIEFYGENSVELENKLIKIETTNIRERIKTF